MRRRRRQRRRRARIGEKHQVPSMLRHARALWGSWWWAPALPWLGYTAGLALCNQVRWEHVFVALVATVTAYGGARPRRFFLNALPLLVLFLFYDSMRYWKDVGLTSERVLGCELRTAELALFGVHAGGRLLTPNELLGRLQHPALDLLCAVPYGAYLGVLIGHYVVLSFTDPGAARRLAWLALTTHLLAIATYHLVPAAPPWYIARHGCTIDLAVESSPAALARVDAMLGTSYFHDLYSRGSAVFGALPSLHAAYPLFGLFATFGRSSKASKAIQLGYAFLMWFAAIYLNHHWLLDLLLGMAYAVIAAAAVRRCLPEPDPGSPDGTDVQPQGLRLLVARTPTKSRFPGKLLAGKDG